MLWSQKRMLPKILPKNHHARKHGPILDNFLAEYKRGHVYLSLLKACFFQEIYSQRDNLGLTCCTCHGAPLDDRIWLVQYQLASLASLIVQALPIIHVSHAEEGLLQSYFLVA